MSLKAEEILVLDYKKIDDDKSTRKIFRWSAKLIADDSGNDTAFESMHQSTMTSTKNFFGKQLETCY